MSLISFVLCTCLIVVGIIAATNFQAQFSISLVYYNNLVFNLATHNLVLEPIKPTLSEKSYIFTINNGSSTKYSNTPIEYTISLEKTNNLPLNVVLKDNANPKNILIELTPSILTGTAGSTYTLAGGSFSEDYYNLYVSWDSGAGFNDYKYSNLLDALIISVDYGMGD